MSNSIITANNIGKKYIIRHKAELYFTLREQIAYGTKNIARRIIRPRQYNKSSKEQFWALHNISFEVKQGERIGIIGHNGAGKSTLLKILSRITEPTTGRIKMKGRVASLLEVGTGFHPELTGRENIYLNGAILGMTRNEINQKFNEIVAFAEIEKFLDTPVKRYSSGMYVRLAFAVAAHLEPEILLIDEVLAVGDIQFQKKCLGKMKTVGQQGRTVIFVSHNMAAISNLCSRCIYLDAGEIKYIGETKKAIEKYVNSGNVQPGTKKWPKDKLPGNDEVKLESVSVVASGNIAANVFISKDFQINIKYKCLKPNIVVYPAIHVRDEIGLLVFASADFPSANLNKDSWFKKKRSVGTYISQCTIPGNFLNDKTYHLDIGLVSENGTWIVNELDILCFTVEETGEMRKEYIGQWTGTIRPKLFWQTQIKKGNKWDT